MKTRTFPQASSKWLIPFADGRPVLPLLLTRHLGGFLLICFKPLLGLQSWAALPLINGLATFWLLAKSQTQLLNWNENP
jgi:hypothetical protein